MPPPSKKTMRKPFVRRDRAELTTKHRFSRICWWCVARSGAGFADEVMKYDGIDEMRVQRFDIVAASGKKAGRCHPPQHLFFKTKRLLRVVIA